MASYEVDPLFCKALKLLHSNAKDSADQIMHLLEETIEQKYGGTKSLNLKCGSLLLNDVHKVLDCQKNARSSRGSSPVSGAVSVAQNSEKSSRDSTPLSEPVSSRTSPVADDGDIALEIFEDDLNCTVCKGMSVGARNRLVECSDCHLLYHQECHKPPISENDVNDPRLVWYCSDCIKKAQEKIQPKMKALHSELSHKKSKSESTTDKSSLFKRNEKNSLSNASNLHAKNSGVGLGHLAAALQASKSSSGSTATPSTSAKHHSSSSGSKSATTLNYSKNPGSPNPKAQSNSVPASANIIAADKRLQNMKKKAAAKMQEKRSKHK